MIRNIQVLRALAAYLVVAFHAIELLSGRPYAWGWTFGTAGVDIFFVISGFIMVHTTRDGATPFDFARNRVTRIVPLYWLMTLAVFAIALVAPSLMRSTTADVGELIKSLFFIPYARETSGLMQPMLFVGWTLNLEMLFYAIFAASLWFGRKSVWVAVAAIAALVTAGFFVEGAVPKFLTNPIMLEFAAGMLIARYRLLIPRNLAYGALALGLVLLLTHRLVLPGLDGTAARFLPAVAIVIAAISLEKHGLAINNRLALLLGNASYALYLSHPFVTAVFLRLFLDASLPIRLAAFAAAMVGAGVLAVAIHKLVEQPVTRFLKRRRKAGEVKVAATGM